MTHALAFVLSLLGFAGLACATRRQQRDLLRRSLRASTVTALRIAASIALLLALAALVGQFGTGLGLVMFSGHTSLAAGLVTCGLIAAGRANA